jgi:hypothetical protein
MIALMTAATRPNSSSQNTGMFGFTEVLYTLVELGNLLVRVPEDSAHRIQEREYCG